jgi:fluoroquinolone transport system permease protein
MVSTKTLRALGAMDVGSALADPLLRWMAALPLAVALAVRLALPAGLARVGELAGVDLGWLLAPLSGYVVVGMAPLLAGALVGFLLLDQRDDRTLLALRVTPLPLGVYIAYRLVAPALLAAVVTLAAVAVAGGAGLSLPGALVAALAAAPLAPVAALALAALARNKVQGLALLKAASVVLAAPLAGLFLSAPWQAALLALPTCQVARAVWALQAGAPAWPWVAGSWAVAGLLGGLLYLRLRRALGGGA